ncbi:MAG: sensor domain-containing protein [Mycobacteriaceae bacterium]|nr:sensor domain-containing protein [Mycobacteriaceae bacterium]
MEGTPFGRYRLIDLLGRGGMGEVWRARDTATNNRIVAIKLLPAHLANDQEFVWRFRREADAAAQLNNPHIIPIHTYGEIDGRLYVDMRLVEGRDLQQTVMIEGPLEPERAVRVIEQIAKALNAAHKVGLVHRDVKPSNILLDEDDFAYLIDFGIARGAEETRLTGTGNVIGSWHYIAPERLQSGHDDGRGDIYALACVLYECLTGQPPYPGNKLEQQVTAHLTAPPPRPSRSHPGVPVAFDAVIATGMAKKPEHRYGMAVELASAARAALKPPSPSASPRRPLVSPSSRVYDYDQALQQARLHPARPASPAVPNHLSRNDPGLKPARSIPRPSPPPTAKPWWRRIDPIIASISAVLVDWRRRIFKRHAAPGRAASPGWWRRKTHVLPVAVLSAALICALVLVLSWPERAPPEPLLPPGALDRILVTAADAASIVDGPLRETGSSSILKDDIVIVKDQTCVGTLFVAQASVYKGTDWTHARTQNLETPTTPVAHLVSQAAVLFSSADDAAKFYRYSLNNWHMCGSQTTSDQDATWSVSPLTEIGKSMMTQPFSKVNASWRCEHTMAVAANLIAEAVACGTHAPTDQTNRIVTKMMDNASAQS